MCKHFCTKNSNNVFETIFVIMNAKHKAVSTFADRFETFWRI